MNINNGKCRKCKGSVVWVSRDDGSFFPPFEIFTSNLSPEVAIVMQAAGSIYVVTDGELKQFFLNTVLMRHNCPEVKPVEPPEDYDVYLAYTYDCPSCNAKRDERCITKSGGVATQPHLPRIKVANGG